MKLRIIHATALLFAVLCLYRDGWAINLEEFVAQEPELIERLINGSSDSSGGQMSFVQASNCKGQVHCVYANGSEARLCKPNGDACQAFCLPTISVFGVEYPLLSSSGECNWVEVGQ